MLIALYIEVRVLDILSFYHQHLKDQLLQASIRSQQALNFSFESLLYHRFGFSHKMIRNLQVLQPHFDWTLTLHHKCVVNKFRCLQNIFSRCSQLILLFLE